jgi:chromosome segregation ATPase
VDLAGSERVKKSKATGLRFDEAKNINLALLALGNCIQALADKKSKFVPFRDSKLTRLLANSLGGKSKTSLIITVGPSLVHVNETLMTLGFGARAMKIEVTPSVSKLIDYKAVSAKLKAELELLNEKYQALVRTNEKLLGQIEDGKKEMEHVTMEQLKAEQTAKDYLKLMDGTVEKEKANAGKEQLNELQAIYEEKIHRKDEEYTKLLKDFDQFIQESDAENEKLRKENAQFAESNNNFKQKLNTLKSEREEESASIAAQLSQVAQENVSFKAEIEDLRDECNAKEIVIKNHESRKKTLEEKNRKLLKDLEELRKGIPGPKQTDAERTRDAQKDQMIQELEFLNGKLETELREAELLLGEKREEMDQLRAEIAKTDIKSLKRELERANKEVKNQNQAKKALELQISDLSFQLQVSLSTPQPAPSVQSYALSETQVRFAETLLLPLQDSLEVDYDQLESKLMTVLESVTSNTPPTEAAIADFSEALYTATHPETANQLSNLKTTICDLEDQLNIATQHAESQKEQYTELVRGYIDATV